MWILRIFVKKNAKGIYLGFSIGEVYARIINYHTI